MPATGCSRREFISQHPGRGDKRGRFRIGSKRYSEIAALLAENLGEDVLTARELEVLSLIRDGYRNKQHAVTIALRRGLLEM
jgi:ATP/maltotriose-dependent transcriptional regulator MalT